MSAPSTFRPEKYFPPPDFEPERYFTSEDVKINAGDAPVDLPPDHQSVASELPPTPEPQHAIAAQMKALLESRRAAVLVTPGSPLPSVPDGYTTTATAKGIFIHSPRRVTSEWINKMVADGRHGELLGHVEPKSESTTAGVIARDPQTGDERMASYTSPENVPAQVAEMRRQFPGSQMEVGGRETEDRLLRERTEASGAKIQPPSDFQPERYFASPRDTDSGSEPRSLSVAEIPETDWIPAAGHDAPPVAGDWRKFPEESGSLNVPRASMPQIKSEHRGAMVQFLKGRGVTHEKVDVAPNTLKPSQAEYSPEKVERARNFEGPQRSILISSDDHVLDGHHQWLDSLTASPYKPAPAIRFNAPIRQLLIEAARFPSSTVDKKSPSAAPSDDISGGSAHLGGPPAGFTPEKYLPRGSATSRAVEDADFSDMEERPAQAITDESRYRIPVKLAQGEETSIAPDELARRAVFEFAATHGIPDDFRNDWIRRQEEAGRLKLYDLKTNQPTTIQSLIEAGKQTGEYDERSNTLTLQGDALLDDLLRDYEQNKSYTQRIRDDYNDPTKRAGAVALDVVGPPVAAAARGLNLVSRPAQAISTGLSGVARALDPSGAVRLSEWFAGKQRGSAWDILRGTFGAVPEELQTGHTREGYENPLSATVDNFGGGAFDKINPNLRPLVRSVADIIGDPLIALGAVGKLGRVARAGEALADGAGVEARLARMASTIEQRLGVHPNLERLADNSIKVTADFFGDGTVHSFTIKPGGEVAAAVETAAAMERSPSLVRRVGREALDVLNIPRTIQASYDLSAPGRQGLVLAVNHPVHAARAFGAQLRALSSEESASKALASIFQSPMQPLREQSGLFLSSLENASLGHREEVFISRLAESLPGVKQSERAYTTFLDSLRSNVFDSYVTSHPHATPEDLKGIAQFINYSTGRGSLGPLEGTKAAQVLSQAFFSPRLTVSRAELLATPFMGTPASRKFAARHLVVFVGSGMSTLALARAAGAKVETDLRSSAFGKIQIGNQQIDIWGGFQQPARHIAQFITGQAKTGSGRVVDRGRGETAKNFLRTRLSPQAGIAWDVVTGKTFMGEPATLRTLAREHLVPLAASDIIEAVQDDRAQGRSGWRGGAIGSLSLVGVGVQTHEQKGQTPRAVTDKQKGYLYSLADHLHLNEDDESARLFNGRKVSELNPQEASQLIEHLKLPGAGKTLTEDDIKLKHSQVSDRYSLDEVREEARRQGYTIK